MPQTRSLLALSPLRDLIHVISSGLGSCLALKSCLSARRQTAKWKSAKGPEGMLVGR